MKSLDFGRCLLHASAIGALLTGCSGSQSPISAPAAMRQDLTSPRQGTSLVLLIANPPNAGNCARLVRAETTSFMSHVMEREMLADEC